MKHHFDNSMVIHQYVRLYSYVVVHIVVVLCILKTYVIDLYVIFLFLFFHRCQVFAYFCAHVIILRVLCLLRLLCF